MAERMISVIVDRPLGSRHPKYPELYYPINYGYVEGIIAPDGEEQDVYILGIDKPVTRFTGKMLAVVKRRNDTEYKWVVGPIGKTFTKKEIKEAVNFQEKYFDCEIILI